MFSSLTSLRGVWRAGGGQIVANGMPGEAQEALSPPAGAGFSQPVWQP
ncbi:hypothetical protein [Dickeya ananatis]